MTLKEMFAKLPPQTGEIDIGSQVMRFRWYSWYANGLIPELDNPNDYILHPDEYTTKEARSYNDAVKLFTYCISQPWTNMILSALDYEFDKPKVFTRDINGETFVNVIVPYVYTYTMDDAEPLD